MKGICTVRGLCFPHCADDKKEDIVMSSFFMPAGGSERLLVIQSGCLSFRAAACHSKRMLSTMLWNRGSASFP